MARRSAVIGRCLALCAPGYAKLAYREQTLSMQNRARREYAARRRWTVFMQVREVNSGAAQREAREKLLEAARRREIDVVLVWRRDR